MNKTHFIHASGTGTVYEPVGRDQGMIHDKKLFKPQL
jgi:hypothetical protein